MKGQILEVFLKKLIIDCNKYFFNESLFLKNTFKFYLFLDLYLNFNKSIRYNLLIV